MEQSCKICNQTVNDANRYNHNLGPSAAAEAPFVPCPSCKKINSQKCKGFYHCVCGTKWYSSLSSFL